MKPALLLLVSSLAFAQSFPSSIYTPPIAKDNVATTLSIGMQAGDTTAFVVSTTGWQANMYAYVCESSTASSYCTGSFEIMKVTSVSGSNALNVTRAQAGTSATSHAAGKLISNAPTSVYHKSNTDEIVALETALGINLSNVGVLSDNNTFSGTNTFTGTVNMRGAAHTSPAQTGLIANKPATCTVGDQYFATDAVAGQNLYLCTSTNAWTAQTATVTTTTSVNAADYNFAAQTPGGSIAPGSNSISLIPCPTGVNGTDANHYLYISGGTGTAEAVLITGGSCASGASAGTVTVTAANSHSGAWTIRSATAGMEEAILAAPGGVQLDLPVGTLSVHATTTVPTNAWIRGAGKYTTIVSADASMTNANVFTFASSGLGQISDLMVQYPAAFTPGTTIGVSGGSHDFRAERLIITGGGLYGANIGLDCGASATCRLEDVDVYEPKTWAFQFASAAVEAVHAAGVCDNPQPCSGIFHLVAGNTVMLDQPLTEGGTYGIYFDVANNTSGFGQALVLNPIVDKYHSVGIYLRCYNTCAIGGNYIDILGGQILPTSDPSSGIVITSGGVANAWSQIKIEGSTIASYGASQSPIWISGVTGAKIANNILTGSPANSGTGINISTYPALNVDITGNTVSYDINSGSSSCPFYQAVNVDNSGHANIYADGNKLCGYSATISDTDTTGALSVTANNVFTLAPPTVASAAALAIPPDPFFYLSGTTGVTSVTNVAASAPKWFSFIATNASPGAWTAGATIGKTFTPAQNQLVTCFWDGTKAYCK